MILIYYKWRKWHFSGLVRVESGIWTNPNCRMALQRSLVFEDGIIPILSKMLYPLHMRRDVNLEKSYFMILMLSNNHVWRVNFTKLQILWLNYRKTTDLTWCITKLQI
jgi:hypothetical protein